LERHPPYPIRKNGFSAVLKGRFFGCVVPGWVWRASFAVAVQLALLGLATVCMTTCVDLIFDGCGHAVSNREEFKTLCNPFKTQ
jgi:hypothetical protein